MGHDGMVAMLDGRLEETAAIVERMMARGQQLGMERLAAYWAWARCGRALIYLGRAGETQILGQVAGQTSDDAFMLAHVGASPRVEGRSTLGWPDTRTRYRPHRSSTYGFSQPYSKRQCWSRARTQRQ